MVINYTPSREDVTVAEAVEVRPVTRWTINRLIASGELPAYRIGSGKTRIRLADLDRLARPVVPKAITAQQD